MMIKDRNSIEDDLYFIRLREDIINEITPENYEKLMEMGNSKQISIGKCLKCCLDESFKKIEAKNGKGYASGETSNGFD